MVLRLNKELDPHSFQRLAEDLIQENCGLGTVIFGPGSDGGRDAVFEGAWRPDPAAESWTGYTVFQAKFRQRITGDKKDADWLIDQVRQELEAFARPETPRRKPDNYVLISNVPLSGVPRAGGVDRLSALLDQAGFRQWMVWHEATLETLLRQSHKTRRHWQGDDSDSVIEAIRASANATIAALRKREGIQGPLELFCNYPASGIAPRPSLPPTHPLLTSYVRRKVDEEIELELQNGGCVGVTGVVGMGGLGKTFLAMRVAAEYCRTSDHGVVWVGLLRRNVEDALTGFAECFGLEFRNALRLDEKTAALQALLAACHQSGQRLLVVLDNAERFEGLETLLDLCRTLPVLVTSRRREGGLRVSYHSMDILTPSEAEALCHRLIERQVKLSSLRPAERDGLAQLCDYLGGHPLGIRLAVAGLMRQRRPVAGWDIAGLCAALRLRPLEVLRDCAASLDGIAGAAFSASVQATFDWLYQDLPSVEGQTGNLAHVLLPVIAVLAPVPMRRDDLLLGVQSLAKVAKGEITPGGRP